MAAYAAAPPVIDYPLRVAAPVAGESGTQALIESQTSASSAAIVSGRVKTLQHRSP
jgi:hypothetical protein